MQCLLWDYLQNVIHILVGPEQSGFLPSRGAYNNIIAAHEIALSLETDPRIHLRMIYKIDIEKAFYIIEWTVVIATL